MNLDLLTSSYATYTPGMGVPVGTSIGRHPAFRGGHEIDTLKPFGIFRVMDDEPVEVQARAYRARLNRRQGRLWQELTELADAYPGTPLVLLCWCRPEVALAGGCHRRWAAQWFENEHGLRVPEAALSVGHEKIPLW